MTIEYGVTKKTAYREYCATFSSQLAIPEDERKLLQKEEIFLLIFNFFKEGLVAQELFFHTSAEWTAIVLKKPVSEFKLPDLTMCNFYYFKDLHIMYYENTNDTSCDKRIRHSLSLNYNIHSALETYLVKLARKNRKNCYSTQKTKTAAYVNAIHALDASYLRNIIKLC